MSFLIKGGILKKYTEEPGITEVIVPDGVKTIGKEAFMDCKNIVSVILPNGIESIGQSAFYRCRNLESIIIPDGVSKINDGTFAYCGSLRNIQLPDSVTAIGSKKYSVDLCRGVFYDCKNLKEVVIPQNCTYICYDAFGGCSEDLVVVAPAVTMADGKNIHVKHSYGWGFLLHSKIYVPSVVEAYSQYVGSQKKYYLPEIFKKDLVEALATYAQLGKITKTNFEKDYLAPATDCGAVQCIAYLLEWKQAMSK